MLSVISHCLTDCLVRWQTEYSCSLVTLLAAHQMNTAVLISYRMYTGLAITARYQDWDPWFQDQDRGVHQSVWDEPESKITTCYHSTKQQTSVWLHVTSRNIEPNLANSDRNVDLKPLNMSCFCLELSKKLWDIWHSTVNKGMFCSWVCHDLRVA